MSLSREDRISYTTSFVVILVKPSRLQTTDDELPLSKRSASQTMAAVPSTFRICIIMILSVR